MERDGLEKRACESRRGFEELRVVAADDGVLSRLGARGQQSHRSAGFLYWLENDLRIARSGKSIDSLEHARASRSVSGGRKVVDPQARIPGRVANCEMRAFELFG